MSGFIREAGQPVRRFDYIDALRGIAFLMVMTTHVGAMQTDMAAQVGPLPAWIWSLASHGDRGVQLFYVISAVTLFMSLEHRVTRERRPYTGFFLRRFFRIAPMFYVIFGVWLWVLGLGPNKWAPHGISAAQIVSTLTFTNAWHPYWISSVVFGGWSVAVEMMFYLLVPFRFSTIRSLRAAAWLMVGTMLICLAWNYLVDHWQPIPELKVWQMVTFFSFPSQLPVFAIGIFCYFMIKELHARIDEKPSQSWGKLMVFAAILLGFMATREGDDWQQFRLPPHVYFGAIFAILAAGMSLWHWPLLVNRFTRFTGKVSYSAYLIHFLIVQRLARLADTQWHLKGMVFFAVVMAGTLCGTLIASTVTYYLIELPGQALGKKIIKRIQVPVPVMVTAGGI